MTKKKSPATVETLAAPPTQDAAPDPTGAAALAAAESTSEGDAGAAPAEPSPEPRSPEPPKRGRGRPRKDRSASQEAPSGSPRPRRDKSALQMRAEAAEAELMRLRGANELERIASRALRPTFEVAGSFMNKWRGWDLFTPAEVNALTDGWAPVVAPWLSPESGPWFGAIMATIAVALPRALKDAGIQVPAGEAVANVPGGTVHEIISEESR